MKTKNELSKVNHILVIDDDLFLLGTMRKKLELANYIVTVSNNVYDAHLKLNSSEPDLILLDMIMPDMNGIEFMSIIKPRLITLNIPIILMSYLSKKKLLEMGYSLGSAHYLPKPFNINRLPFLLNESIAKA